MQNKRRALDGIHWGRKKAEEYYQSAPKEFDYGPLDRLAIFRDTHPRVMQERIRALDWQDRLQYEGSPDPRREPHKHERRKYRFLSWVEKHFLGGKPLGGFRNYELLDV